MPTVAKEARSIGIHQNFTLVVEPIRDPRLGRNEEAFSEDPFLCSRIAETIVRSMQGNDVSADDHVVSGLCHYPGQSQPVSGFERGAMEISERMLREVFLPPWEAGIKKCGALGVMATYPAIDGVPTHASEKIADAHPAARNWASTAWCSPRAAGSAPSSTKAWRPNAEGGRRDRPGRRRGRGHLLRVGLHAGPAGQRPRRKGADEPDRPQPSRRILKQKFRLGLFEKPLVDVERAVQTVHQPAHQDLALQAAREAIVLLKNEKNLLPLKKTLRSIAVIGPNADDAAGANSATTSRGGFRSTSSRCWKASSRSSRPIPRSPTSRAAT